MNKKANTLTCQFGKFFSEKNKQIFQQSHVILKSENILNIYVSNISFNFTLDKPISKLSLL